MPQRTKVVGTRTPMMWLLVVLAVVLIAALAVGAFVVLPQQQQRLAARERAAQAEQHYQAGIAFEGVNDWPAAEAEYKQVIAIAAGHKDTQARLAEVKARQAKVQTTATAVANAEAAQKQAAASAKTQAAQAAPTVTAEALEDRYQRALGLINLQQWVEAQLELRAIFDIDPNYRDVQTQLSIVNKEIVKLTPTATPTSEATPTPTPISTPSCLPPPPGLVSLWTGDDGTRDSVGPNEGYPEGEVTSVAGLVGQAFEFTGNNAVMVRDHPTLNPARQFTIEAWVMPSITQFTPVIGIIVNKEAVGGPIQYEIGINSNTIRLPRGQLAFFVEGIRQSLPDYGGGWNDGGAVISEDRWSHVAMVVNLDEGVATTFVDGQLAIQHNVSTTSAFSLESGDLRIGNRVWYDGAFVGLIDEVSFYGRALSAAEVRAIFTVGAAGKCRG